jgi:hypothetical protein
VRRLLAAVVACSACVVGPNLVSAPMLSSVPVARARVDASAPDDAETEPEDRASPVLAGTFSGRAWQSGNRSWPLTVTFETRGATVLGHAHYPDQHCRAEWTLRSARPRQWVGEESVRVDPFNRCRNHGRVSVDWIDLTTLRWSWSGPGGTATAKLERSAQP